LKEKLK